MLSTFPEADPGSPRDGAGGSPGSDIAISLPLGDVLDLQVPYAPQIDPVSPAVVSESDKGIVAAWAADDGAQPPHLVNHRCPDLIGPSAVLAGVMRGGSLEGEDLPEGASCSVPVQP